MPVVLVTANCQSKEGLQDLYYRLPLKAGQDPKNIKTKDIHVHTLVHVAVADQAHVLSWSYGGAQRVAKVNEKRQMAADELAWCMHKYPGMLDVTDHTDDGEGTTIILLERVKKVERELQVAQAERDKFAEEAKSATDRIDHAEARSQKLAIDIEKLTSERDTATKDNLQLTTKVKALETEVAKLKKA